MNLFRKPNEKDPPIPQRDTGYYWARQTETSTAEIIYWTSKKWKRIAIIYDFCDEDFYSIGEQITY